MPEHIRALIVVTVLGSLVWLLVRPAMIRVVPLDTYLRWRRYWFITTLAWFLAHGFWIYVGIMVVLLFRAGRREEHVFGLYLLLLMAAPQAQMPIPGFGVVDHIFMLDHYRLLALALLLPVAMRVARLPTTARLLSSPVDGVVLVYLLFNSILAFREASFTGGARTAVMLWVDLFLPYYVASRSIRSNEGFRHALAGLAMAGLLLSMLAVFEVLRRWKLYDAATAALGLNTFGSYKVRGPFIRPSVSAIDSIVLGYVIVVATGAFLYLKDFFDGRLKRWIVLGLLITGIVFSLSRGPWVGAGLLALVFVLTGEKPIKRLTQAALGASALMLILSMTPRGQQLIDLLPFVGQEEQGNVEYRASLLTVSMPVIARNLLFGSSDYLSAPELQVMKQGEGIIDIVNSYVGVALSSGLVGLTAFLGMFAYALVVVRRGTRKIRRTGNGEEVVLGRALSATLLSIMFIIFTVSSIFVVPTVYVSVIGISCAFGLLMHARTAGPDRGLAA